MSGKSSGWPAQSNEPVRNSEAGENQVDQLNPFDYRNTAGDLITWNISILIYIYCRFRGAMVARLTPDQKAACSNHVGINWPILIGSFQKDH